jgi:hypothetical protein
MPVEWLMQVMSFLSLSEIFISRSVCKKWYVAARHLLEYQEEILLSLDKLPEDSELDRKNAMHFVCSPNVTMSLTTASSLIEIWDQDGRNFDYNGNRRDMVKVLSHLKNLKKITIAEDMALSYRNNHNEETNEKVRRRMLQQLFNPIVHSLISLHAPSLTVLDMDGVIFGESCLPSDDSLIFHQLKQLTCRQITAQEIFRCPRLRKLSVEFTDSLEHLLIDRMQELELRGTSCLKDIHVASGEKPGRERERLLQIVPRLINLKFLRIHRKESTAWSTKFPDVGSEFKMKLLQNHTKLEVLSLRFLRSLGEAGQELHEDNLMQQLAATNPNIREINDLYLTEKGFRSLSSMNKLTQVTGLRVTSLGDLMPMLMMLLIGNSRHTLCKVEIGVRYGSGHQSPSLPFHTLSQKEIQEQIRNEAAVVADLSSVAAGVDFVASMTAAWTKRLEECNITVNAFIKQLHDAGLLFKISTTWNYMTVTRLPDAAITA